MPKKDKQEKRIVIIEPGDILMIRLGDDIDLTPAEAHQFGAAMKLLDINSLVVSGDFKLGKISHADLTKMKEQADAQARSRFARNDVRRKSGDAVPVREPSGGGEQDATDRRRDSADAGGPRNDPRGFVVHDRRVHPPR